MSLGTTDENEVADRGGLTEGQFLLLEKLASAYPEATPKATLARGLDQSKSKVEKDMQALRKWERPGPLAISGQKGYAAMPAGVQLVERLARGQH